MTLADVGNLGEFVGAIGVVGSLVYPALHRGWYIESFRTLVDAELDAIASSPAE